MGRCPPMFRDVQSRNFRVIDQQLERLELWIDGHCVLSSRRNTPSRLKLFLLTSSANLYKAASPNTKQTFQQQKNSSCTEKYATAFYALLPARAQK